MIVPPRLSMAIDRIAGRAIYRAHRFLYERSGGRIGRSYSGGRIVLLTTTGRKTGERRTTPLLSMPDGDRYVLVASNAGRSNHPDWYRNLKADPQVEIQDGPRTTRMLAREAVGAERERLWARVGEMYRGYSVYQQETNRLIPVVVVEPPEDG